MIRARGRFGYDDGNDSHARNVSQICQPHHSIAASSSVRPRRCRCRPRVTRTYPAATTACGSRSSAAAGARRAHIDLINRFAGEGKPVAAVAVCDVWDGLEDEYDVHFGGKVTRRRYSQGLYPSARKCGLDRNDKKAVTKDYRVVLDRKDVDVVCVTTPDHWHGRMTLDALAAGKDVFVEKPMTRTAEEAVAVVDAWKHSGRVVTVGVQSMADASGCAPSTRSAPARSGTSRHAQTGFFRNDIRGQWRFYRLAKQMTPKTVDWDLFLGHQFECAGSRVGPTPREQPFDRASFAQWRCLWPFSGGPFTDMLTHHITRMSAAMGVRLPARVTAGGGCTSNTTGATCPTLAPWSRTTKKAVNSSSPRPRSAAIRSKR